jgi:cell division protein FtsB
MSWRRAITGSLSRHATVIAVVVVLATLLGALAFGSRGLLHLWSLEEEEHRVRERITRLLEENDGLRTRLETIRHDQRALERLAREELGLVRPNEIIYRFPAKTTGPPR